MHRSVLLLILVFSSYSSFSQPTSVRLSGEQARRVADSLTVLPWVRREAAAWRLASHRYERAADSLGQAAGYYRQALQAQQRAFATQQQQLAAEAQQTHYWRQRARRRGVLGWLGLALAGGAGYLLGR
jgi:hypothetical protein